MNPSWRAPDVRYREREQVAAGTVMHTTTNESTPGTDHRCLVCSGTRHNLLCLKEGKEYSRCTTCGHVFLKAPESARSIVERYVKRESHHASNAKETWDYSEIKERLVYGPLLRKLAKFAAPGPLLDIGCSNGAFLHAARRKRWEPTGLELEEASAKVAERHGIKVLRREVAEAGFPSEHFSVVTMWQVIEHLHDPRHVVEEIYRILKPAGVFVLSTPNIRSIGWFLLKEHWGAVAPDGHLHLFTSAGLERLVRDCGFQTRALYTCDIKPSTLKGFLRRVSRQKGATQDRSFADFASKTSPGHMKSLLILRVIPNFFLRIFAAGEDIYGFFQKPAR